MAMVLKFAADPAADAATIYIPSLIVTESRIDSVLIYCSCAIGLQVILQSRWTRQIP